MLIVDYWIDLPQLEIFSLGENGLYCDSANSSVTISNLPSLANFTSVGGSFRGVSNVTISSMIIWNEMNDRYS